MKFNKMYELTSKLEEVKEKLSNWNLSGVDVEFETYGDELTVTFSKECEYLVYDLLTLEDSRQVGDSVCLKF